MDTSKQQTIEARLHEAWREERRFIHTRGACRLMIWLITLLAVDFIIDWGLFREVRMSGGLGLLLLAINLAVLGWALWWEWLRHLRPFDEVLMALEVEERHPELSSLLVSYTQIKGPSEDQPHISSELIAAMRDQAVERSAPRNFRAIVDFAQLKNLFITAGSVLLIFALLSIQWGEHVGVLFQRLAGSNVRYPTQTQITEVTGNLIVRDGDTATLIANAGGVIPDGGRLFTRPAAGGGRWKELPMKRTGDEPGFARELKDLSGDLQYFVRLGDDRSEEYLVRVIHAPQITRSDLTLNYPEYMNRAPGTRDQLDLEVPEGTTIQWELTCDPAVKRFEVKVGDEWSDATIDESGTKLTFEQVANSAFLYTFRWTERDSGKDFVFDDVQYGVRVVSDKAPEIEMLRPGVNGLGTVRKKLKLVARASDDHGLSKAWLVYSLDGSEEKQIPIQEFEGSAARQFGYTWVVRDSIEDLAPGSQITFAIEVTDQYPGEADAHRRRSATRQLTIVEPDRYLEWYRAELAAQNQELKRTRAAEAAGLEKVRQIKIQETPSK